MNRKQRRAHQKKLKHDSNEKLSEKISLFNQLKEECLACTKPFDKQDKVMVESWSVVIREDKDPPVRLYCPDCWEKAQTIAKQYIQMQEKEQQNASDKTV